MLRPIPRINEFDEVIGETTITEAVQQGWPRRLVRTYILDGQQHILLQQRSATIIGSPCCWDAGASGHVDVGEDYRTAALRELAEELGITDAVVDTIALPYKNGINFEGIFRGVVPIDTVLTIDPEEVETVRWVHVEEVDTLLHDAPESFIPEFTDIWNTFRDKLLQY